MLKTMNYQGKGLGLHEKGILDPIHVKENPRAQGLGYISQDSQPKNSFTTFLHPN